MNLPFTWTPSRCRNTTKATRGNIFRSLTKLAVSNCTYGGSMTLTQWGSDCTPGRAAITVDEASPII